MYGSPGLVFCDLEALRDCGCGGARCELERLSCERDYYKTRRLVVNISTFLPRVYGRSSWKGGHYETRGLNNKYFPPSAARMYLVVRVSECSFMYSRVSVTRRKDHS